MARNILEEHVPLLANKGTVTIVSGSTTVMTTINGFVGDYQPIVSFSIAAVAGFFTIWVGYLAVREKQLNKEIAKEKARQDRELHDLIICKQQIEILKLKADYYEKN